MKNEEDFISSINGVEIDSHTKAKFRLTNVWKRFRDLFYIADVKTYKNGNEKIIPGEDYVSRKKLKKGFNLHHLIADSRRYTELDMDNFVAVNSETHDIIHAIYTHMCIDKTYLDRLIKVLNKMGELNDWKDFR